MATILDELRKLEEQRRRGELADAEFRKLRQEIFDLIEDAELAGATPNNADTDTDAEARDAPFDLDLDDVTDAEIIEDDDEYDDAACDSPKTQAVETNEFLREGALVLVGFALCLGVGTWLFGDPMFAFTLGLGILAIFTIRAFQKIDDWD